MKTSKFTDSQIMAILKQVEAAAPVLRYPYEISIESRKDVFQADAVISKLISYSELSKGSKSNVSGITSHNSSFLRLRLFFL